MFTGYIRNVERTLYIPEEHLQGYVKSGVFVGCPGCVAGFFSQGAAILVSTANRV